jgi:hypothetical protein
MKKLISLTLILLLSCTIRQTDNNAKTEEVLEQQKSETQNVTKNNKQFCWKGKLNTKTNILLHYQIQDDLIFGEISYLDTKEKKPIRIIGTIEEDSSIRLLEFNNKGNITGIITGLPKDEELTGNWFSPKTNKESSLNLNRIDTILENENIETNLENVIGDYHYQYSEAGYQGDLTIRKVNADEISFSILSVTGEPGRNMAIIETDTIEASTDFIYKLPNTENCEFKIRIFKDFAFIKYTEGFCEGIFGHNATIEGIFYKQK